MDTFRDLTVVTTLLLSQNEFKSFPSRLLAHQTYLKLFDASHNRLTALPPGLFNATTSLEVLIIAANRLTRLAPGELAPLTNLDLLALNGNPIEEIFLPWLPFLSQLWLGATHISSLHLSLVALDYLNVADNPRLTALTLAASARVAVANVSGTALTGNGLDCGALGYDTLVARNMLRSEYCRHHGAVYTH